VSYPNLSAVSIFRVRSKIRAPLLNLVIGTLSTTNHPMGMYGKCSLAPLTTTTTVKTSGRRLLQLLRVKAAQ